MFFRKKNKISKEVLNQLDELSNNIETVGKLLNQVLKDEGTEYTKWKGATSAL